MTLGSAGGLPLCWALSAELDHRITRPTALLLLSPGIVEGAWCGVAFIGTPGGFRAR